MAKRRTISRTRNHDAVHSLARLLRAVSELLLVAPQLPDVPSAVHTRVIRAAKGLAHVASRIEEL